MLNDDVVGWITLVPHTTSPSNGGKTGVRRYETQWDLIMVWVEVSNPAVSGSMQE